MKYFDGQTISVGDVVRLGSSRVGKVVASIEDDIYLPGIERDEWKYLNSGILVYFEDYGIIHYLEPEEDLALVQREP